MTWREWVTQTEAQAIYDARALEDRQTAERIWPAAEYLHRRGGSRDREYARRWMMEINARGWRP